MSPNRPLPTSAGKSQFLAQVSSRAFELGRLSAELMYWSHTLRMSSVILSGRSRILGSMLLSAQRASARRLLVGRRFVISPCDSDRGSARHRLGPRCSTCPSQSSSRDVRSSASSARVTLPRLALRAPGDMSSPVDARSSRSSVKVRPQSLNACAATTVVVVLSRAAAFWTASSARQR